MSLIKSIEFMDQALYSSYKEDLYMENITLKFKEYYNHKGEITIDKNISAYLYINNNLLKTHYYEPL
jgi:hypothetical protein